MSVASAPVVARALAGDDALEGPVAAALASARRDSAAVLGRLLNGADLDAWEVPSPDGGGVARGRLGAPPAGLDLWSAVDEVLARRDVADGSSTAATARLCWSEAGTDADRMPAWPDVVARHAVGAPVRANPWSLCRSLARGRSFKLRGLEGLHDGIGGLVEHVERWFQVRAGAMAYLSGPGAEGWGAHYDRHDGIVLQVAGSKHWTVYEPVEPAPLRPWTAYAITDRVAWSGLLSAGEWLRVPRGWGHSVVGTEEPSVHLTVPVRRPTVAEAVADALRVTGADPRAEVADLLRRLDGPLGLHGAHHRHPWRSRSLATFSATVAATEALSAGRTGSGWRLVAPAVGGVVAEHGSGGRALLVDGASVGLDEGASRLLAAVLAPGGAGPELVATWPAAVREQCLRLLHDGVVEARPSAGPGERSPGDRAVPGGRPTAVWSDGVPDRPTPVSAGAALRFPSGAVAGEAPLAEADRAGRSAARDAVVAGLGVPSSWPDAWEAPVRGRVAADVLDATAVVAALDDVLAHADLRRGAMAAATGGVALNRPVPEDCFDPPPAPGDHARVRPGPLVRHLVEGTTFICFGVDDHAPELAAWSEQLERATGRRSGWNAYLSHGASEGFGAHWDDHDVLVVQVVGTKRWELHEPVEPAPVRGRSPEEVGGARPWATVDLEPGDVLALPRGWGHRVLGTSTWSVHLTAPLRAPQWGDVLRVGAAIQPTSGPASWCTEATIERTSAFWRGRIPPRPPRRTAASWRAVWSPGPDVLLRFSAPGGVVLVDEGWTGSDLALVVGAEAHPVPSAWRRGLELLVTGSSVRLRDLGRAVGDEVARDLVDGLCTAGLMAVEETP
jgi:ribosomal protein L16 Arg81 hydroxylase